MARRDGSQRRSRTGSHQHTASSKDRPGHAGKTRGTRSDAGRGGASKSPSQDRELPVPRPPGRWADTYGSGSGIEEEVERGEVRPYTRPADEERDLPPLRFRGSTGNPGGTDFSLRTGVQRGNFRGVGPRNYRRSDESLYEDVCEALTRNADVDATDIEVSVDHGEVTLHGTVSDRRTKRHAEDVVDGVRGIADVHNHLAVSGRTSPGR